MLRITSETFFIEFSNALEYRIWKGDVKLKEETAAIKLIELLITLYIYMFVISLFLLFSYPAMLLFVFFVPITCIAGVILFVYLCSTHQLVVSWRAFFLLPHILIYGWWDNSFSMLIEKFTKWPWNLHDILLVCYVIVKCGLPFLLYCFLQVTDRTLAVVSRIFCFILPLFFILAGGIMYA